MPNMYHVELYKKIMQSQNIALWLFWDLFFDCDDDAEERTDARLKHIEETIGLDCIYGVCAQWAILINSTLEGHFHAQGMHVPPFFEFLEENHNAAEWTLDSRNLLSASQFVVCLSTGDLEMAEAIFKAATEASDDDKKTFIALMKNLLLFITNQFGVSFDHDE
jgi:hypothetical protein